MLKFHSLLWMVYHDIVQHLLNLLGLQLLQLLHRRHLGIYLRFVELHMCRLNLGSQYVFVLVMVHIDHRYHIILIHLNLDQVVLVVALLGIRYL